MHSLVRKRPSVCDTRLRRQGRGYRKRHLCSSSACHGANGDDKRKCVLNDVGLVGGWGGEGVLVKWWVMVLTTSITVPLILIYSVWFPGNIADIYRFPFGLGDVRKYIHFVTFICSKVARGAFLAPILLELRTAWIKKKKRRKRTVQNCKYRRIIARTTLYGTCRCQLESVVILASCQL